MKASTHKIPPLEKIYLSLSKRFAPFAIQFWIKAGTLPPLAEMETALTVAATANPGARLLPVHGQWIDSGHIPCVRTIPAGVPFSLSHPLLHDGFDHARSPAIEVLYWPGAGLVFRCAHALMDGGGLLFFAEETFRALRGEALLGSCGTLSDHHYLARFKQRTSTPALRSVHTSPMGPSNGKTGFIWEHRFVSGQVSAIGARLAAALGTMAHQRQPNARVRILLPVDLRQTDTSLRGTRNLSRPLFLDSCTPTPWSALHARIVTALGRHEELSAPGMAESLMAKTPAPLVGAAAHSLHHWQVAHDRYLVSAVVSHLGRVSLSAFCAPGFSPQQATMLPFDTPGAGLTLVTMQHENGVEIAASCPVATGDGGRLNTTLDLLCNTLELGSHSGSAPLAGIAGVKPAQGPITVVPPQLTVDGLIARQAATHPERLALHQGTGLSYAELEARINACACTLRSQGVQPGNRVALLAGRSMQTIIALLGILRLGAAFVPLDTEWPEERMRLVLEDCRPACLVTDRSSAPQPGILCIALSELTHSTNPLAHHPIAPHSQPESPAYVLYTSGSTGRPKGVVVAHRSLLNYVLWATQAYLTGLDGPVVFPFFTSLAFDLTLTALFVPLVSGGVVKVFPDHDALQAIRAILADTAVNAVKLTPSHLRLMAGLGLGASGLRKFVVGGEALSTNLSNDVSTQLYGRADIFNEYGPTEATVGCVVHRFDPAHDKDAFVPIGHPIMNTEVLLLDDQGHCVAQGATGEIYLAGDCLALGYLDRPQEELRFSPHPNQPGKRMYRTGDRALQSPNGEFMYLGRMDGQVKLRGRRIELGEIEAAIDASDLCNGYTALLEQAAAGPRLAAFVTWRDGATEEALRSFLCTSLPAYMVPTRIVGLQELPLNINGKVDKSRLPVETHGLQMQTSASCPLERELAEIIGALTEGKVPSVQAEESLLELGLDSLQMMLLLTHAARRFLPEADHDRLFCALTDLLEEPTIRKLGATLLQINAQISAEAMA